MEFGIFDHLDRNGLPLDQFYAARLELAEAYDRGGFYAYHCAEHHGSPVGSASSPFVFLSGVAQRTKRLRFGPLVCLLPLYHPLRLIEEICMLDQMSGGRLELGVGQGASPFEPGFFGFENADRNEKFGETLEIILKGLTAKTLNHEGRFYQFRDVPMELESKQKPHPPLWFGLHSDKSAARAGGLGANFCTQDPPAPMRSYTDHYRAAQTDRTATPKLGLVRHVVVAETDAEALSIARRAYPIWLANYTHLNRKYGKPAGGHVFPETFDEFSQPGQQFGRGICGSPETIRSLIRSQIEVSGANYFVSQFAFGDLSQAETLRSVGLFASEVLPALKRELAEVK